MTQYPSPRIVTLIYIKILLEIFAMSCNHFLIFGKYLSDISFTCSFALSIIDELSSDFFTLFRKSKTAETRRKLNTRFQYNIHQLKICNLTNLIITRFQCDCHGVCGRVDYASFSTPFVFVTRLNLCDDFSSGIRRRQFRWVRLRDNVFLRFRYKKLFRSGN